MHHALTENFDAIVEVPLVHFEIVVCIGGENVRETRAGNPESRCKLKRPETSNKPHPKTDLKTGFNSRYISHKE